MTKPSSGKGRYLDHMANKRNQILELIRKKPMGWSELKQISGLSNSTLFRILGKLEREKSIVQELKDKKLSWKLTPRGFKEAGDESTCNFIRNAFRIPNTSGEMSFGDWTPRDPSRDSETKKKVSDLENQFRVPEDEDYYVLSANEILTSLFRGTEGKKIMKRFEKEEPNFSSTIFPYVFTSREPSNSVEIARFCKRIVQQISEEKELLYRWSLPRNDLQIGADYSVTNELYLVIKIELTAQGNKLKTFLNSKENQSQRQSGDKNEPKD